MTDAAPLPDPLPPDDRLTTMGLFVQSYTGVRAACEEDLLRGGLTGSEFEVLIRLARSPGRRLSMSALAAQSTLTNSGLTRLVDRLVLADLVERHRDHADRRVFYAVLTDKGFDQVQAALPSHLEVVEQSLTGVLSPDELAVFVTALRKIRAVVKPGSDPQHAAR